MSPGGGVGQQCLTSPRPWPLVRAGIGLAQRGRDRSGDGKLPALGMGRDVIGDHVGKVGAPGIGGYADRRDTAFALQVDPVDHGAGIGGAA